jgi:pyruvate formate-lyase activating enzyme-like uncharacterized protein
MLSIQEALKRKFERQAQIKELEFHASGHCVHIGKLSPGCLKCFVPDALSENFHLGSACNANCPYCFGVGLDRHNPPAEHRFEHKARLLARFLSARSSPYYPTISFTGGGDPLLHLEFVAYYMDIYRRTEDLLGKKPWYYLYTNGLSADLDTVLRIKDLGFNEMRFHLGASNFSKQVYKNLSVAARHIDVITVETPAWPPHRGKLFEMLPMIEEIGVKHLNLGEIVITPHNRENIFKRLPDAEVYQFHYIHLYDGGLVYDIIEEVLKRRFSYSVLDCSSLVKGIQQAPGKRDIHEPVDGLCETIDQVTNQLVP